MKDTSCERLLARSGVFAGDFAVHHAHARAQALQRNGILHGETAALGSAARIQALDDFPIRVIHVAFCIGLEAPQVAERQSAAACGGVERPVFQSEQALGTLEEIGVPPPALASSL